MMGILPLTHARAKGGVVKVNGLPFELLEDVLGMETTAKRFEAANLRKRDSPLHRGPD